MDRVDSNLRSFNQLEWSGAEGDLGIEIRRDGIEVWGFYHGDYPDDPGGRNVDIGPVLVPWPEIDSIRKRVEEGKSD